MTPPGTKTLLLCLLLAFALPPHEARAEPPEAGEQVKGPLLLSLSGDLSSNDQERVRQLLSEDLGVAIELSASQTETPLSAEIVERTLSARYHRGDTSKSRSVELPRSHEAKLLVVALALANLLRDEGAAYLETLQSAPLPAAPQPETTAEAAQATDSDPSEKEAALPLAPLSVAVVPSVSAEKELWRKKTFLHLGLVRSRLGEVQGAAITLLGSEIESSLTGVQLGTLWTFVEGDARGLSMSAGASIQYGARTGAQMAALYAFNRGRFEGFQLGALAIQQGRMKGAQLGLFNSALAMDGAQVGLINLAQHASTQVGLINIARESSEVAVGLVNIVPQIKHQLELFVSATPGTPRLAYSHSPMGHVGWRMRLNKYTLMFDGGLARLNAGCTSEGTCSQDGLYVSPGFTMGAHLPAPKVFYVDLDLQYRVGIDTNQPESFQHKLIPRLSVGLQVAQTFGIFLGAGPEITVTHEVSPQVELRPLLFAGTDLF